MKLIDFKRKGFTDIKSMNLPNISKYRLPTLETIQKVPSEKQEDLRLICLAHIVEIQKEFNEQGLILAQEDVDKLRRVQGKEGRWLDAQDELRRR